MTLINWLSLLTRVMSDLVVEADAAYLVGQTKDNAQSVLARGVELFQKRLIPTMACLRNDNSFGYFGYCGFGFNQGALRDCGIPEKALAAVDYSGEIGDTINTLTELISLARFARQKGWKKICLIASPFHQLRSFITAVTAIDREYPPLKIYNCIGLPMPWNQQVVHSQGRLTGSRAELITEEFQRIKRYQNVSNLPYPLVSVERTLEYLDWRDTA